VLDLQKCLKVGEAAVLQDTTDTQEGARVGAQVAQQATYAVKEATEAQVLNLQKCLKGREATKL
jgi:hypothetical protein